MGNVIENLILIQEKFGELALQKALLENEPFGYQEIPLSILKGSFTVMSKPTGYTEDGTIIACALRVFATLEEIETLLSNSYWKFYIHSLQKVTRYDGQTSYKLRYAELPNKKGGNMLCPNCKNINSPKRVVNTWTTKSGEVKRKRICSQCKTAFHTIEEIFTKQIHRPNGKIAVL